MIPSVECSPSPNESLVTIEVQPYHVFRYPSEWDPRHGRSKGGYLQGKITLPRNLGNIRMSLSTHECHVSPPDPKLCCFHPTLLHVVRKIWNGRLTAKEPVPNLSHYIQDFDIIGQNVFIRNETSSEDEGRHIEALRMDT